MNDFDGLVTCDHPEVALLLGFDGCKDASRAVQRLARMKRVPAVKMGGAFRFHIPTLKEWIRAQFADQSAPVSEK